MTNFTSSLIIKIAQPGEFNTGVVFVTDRHLGRIAVNGKIRLEAVREPMIDMMHMVLAIGLPYHILYVRTDEETIRARMQWGDFDSVLETAREHGVGKFCGTDGKYTVIFGDGG